MLLRERTMESVYSNWRALRNGVIVSVIVLYLVEPTMKLAIDVIPAFGGRFYNLVWDRAARQAALGGQYLDFTLLAVLFSIVVGAVIGRFAVHAGFSHLMTKRSRRAAPAVSPWTRFTSRVAILMVVLLTPVAASTLLVDFAAQQMKLSFHQRVTVLAPAISDEAEKVLQARFAGLQDRGDYESLNHDIDQLAREKNVTLPASLL
jgi:hypothetical protein